MVGRRMRSLRSGQFPDSMGLFGHVGQIEVGGEGPDGFDRRGEIEPVKQDSETIVGGVVARDTVALVTLESLRPARAGRSHAGGSALAQFVAETAYVATQRVVASLRARARHCRRVGTLVPTMFDSISERFEGIFNRLRGRGRLSEADVDAALREVRLALLEADVNVSVVRDFLERVRARAVGEEVHQSLTPGQQVVKIVHEELVTTLGQANAPLKSGLPSADDPRRRTPGLRQDHDRRQARHSISRRTAAGRCLVAADLQRPAAIEQLQTLGERIGVPVFTDKTHPAPPSGQGGAEGGGSPRRSTPSSSTRPAACKSTAS